MVIISLGGGRGVCQIRVDSKLTPKITTHMDTRFQGHRERAAPSHEAFVTAQITLVPKAQRGETGRKDETATTYSQWDFFSLYQ